MGADCASCISEFEKKNELNHDPLDGQSPIHTPQQRTIQNNETPYFNPTPSSTPYKVDGLASESYQTEADGHQQRQKTDTDNIITLIRVQALIRGFIQRRRFRIQRQIMQGQSKYFKTEEANETLKGVFDKDAPIEEREYQYKTGSVYIGQWKGGMRHGQGTMKWIDGASY